MSPRLRDTVLSGLRLQPKSKSARTDPDDSDTLPMSDFNAAVDPAVVAASTSRPLLPTVTTDTTQPSKSETLTVPPSYNEAMTTSLSGKGNAPSQLVQQFFHGGEVNCLGLTKAVRPVVCLYYELLEQAVSRFIQPRMERCGITDIETPAMRRLVIHSVANYAFMLAIVHASSRYQLKCGIRLCDDDEVHAIRTHVRAEMLQGFLDVMPRLSDTSNPDTGIPYSEVARARRSYFVKCLADRLEYELDDERERLMGIKMTLNTGELDGPKVQECWRLFKAALAQAGGGMHDLLLPLGYEEGKGPEQKCLRPLFYQKCHLPGCPLSRGALTRYLFGTCI